MRETVISDVAGYHWRRFIGAAASNPNLQATPNAPDSQNGVTDSHMSKAQFSDQQDTKLLVFTDCGRGHFA